MPSGCHEYLSNNQSAAQTAAVDAFYDRRIPSVVLMALFCVLGLVGNSVVLMVYWKEKKMSSTHLLIFIIAIYDWVTSLITLPLNILVSTSWFSICSIALCKIYWTLNVFSIIPGIYILAGVSFIRFYHVCLPHRVYKLERKIKHILACIFLFNLLSCMWAAVCYGKEEVDQYSQELPGFVCNINDKCRTITADGVLHFTLITYLICLVCIIVLNYRIVKRVMKQQRIMNLYKIRKHSIGTAATHAVLVNNLILKEEKLEERPTQLNPEELEKRRRSSLSELMAKYNVKYKKKKTKAKDKVHGKDRLNEIKEKQSPDGSLNESENAHDVRINKREGKLSITSTSRLTEMKEHGDTSKIKNKKGNTTSPITSDKSVGSGAGSSFTTNASRNNTQDVESQSKSRTSSPKSDESRRRSVQGEPNRKSVHILETGYKKGGINGGKSKIARRVDSFFLPFKAIFDPPLFNRTTLKVVLVCVVYVITYLPCLVTNLYLRSGNHKPSQSNHEYYKYIFNPSINLIFSGCAVNPFIYTYVDPRFRAHIRALFK